VPVIAAINGVAVGGGCEMALACDFMIAADHARFGQPEVKRGIMPGGGGTQRLPRRIGIGRGKELLYTGRMITAAEAREWGLVNHVVPLAELPGKALELARMIAENGPVAVRQVKKSVDRGIELPLAEALDFEIQAYNICIPSEDRHEGINAFNEKRPAAFKNR
jgi:enoyl-CoA hydratase/carnithine racemase